ncbi:hypothetical protein ACP70R_006276 [Stipagrostis hirtigluma subsp. patula]
MISRSNNTGVLEMADGNVGQRETEQGSWAISYSSLPGGAGQLSPHSKNTDFKLR